jgi:hypothetical protein
MSDDIEDLIPWIPINYTAAEFEEDLRREPPRVSQRELDASEGWVPEYYPLGHPDHVFASADAEDEFWSRWEWAEDGRATIEQLPDAEGDPVESARRDQVRRQLLTRQVNAAEAGALVPEWASWLSDIGGRLPDAPAPVHGR